MSSRDISSDSTETLFKNAIQEKMTSDLDAPKVVSSSKFNAVTFFTSPVGIALCCFCIVFFMLIVINPPFVQKQSENSNGTKRAWHLILLWSVLSAGLVFLLPFAFKQLKR